MKLVMSSVKAILGDSKEVMVYGFGSCQYVHVSMALHALQFRAIRQDIFKGEFEMLDYDKDPHNPNFVQVSDSDDYEEYRQREQTILFARECKALITSLCIYNLKRKQSNESIMPLLFCVESEFPGYAPVSVNIKSVAESHPMLGTYITDEELRRCSKMFYFETEPEFKTVIKETFKFVKLVPDPIDNESYRLQSIPPFWEKPEWEVAWSKRQSMNTPAALRAKQFPWREVTNQKVRAILQKQSLFKRSAAANDINVTGGDDNNNVLAAGSVTTNGMQK